MPLQLKTLLSADFPAKEVVQFLAGAQYFDKI